MSHWSQNPGRCVLSEVETFRDAQGRRETGADDLSVRLSQIANSEAAASWQSAASTAWQERIARVHPTLDAAAQVARSWRSAADRYHQSVAWIQEQEHAAHQLIDTANHTIAAYAHVPGEVLGNPTVQARLEQCERDIAHGYATLYSLNTERVRVDADFAQMLNARATLDTGRDWSALEGLYGGANTVADIRAARVAAIAEANRLADGVEGRNPDLKDIDALTKLLDAMSSDPTLAGDFWAGRGGEDPLALMQKGLQQHMSYPDGLGFLSDEDQAAALAFSRAIRGSLAAGSTTWDDAAARDFAARMVTGDDWPGGTGLSTGTYQGVGFLFDDAEGHPMGKWFTVATADLIDAVERAVGPDGVPRGTSWGDPAASSAYYEAIARADEVDRGVYEDSFAPSQDPTGRVLDTLAVYPDAAWDWLSADGSTLVDGQPAAATDKVDYYASRDWTADGWDGFGSLWESSMRAEGGLMSEPPNTPTWDAQCDVAARVINGLSDGLSGVRPGDLPESGAQALGASLAHLMPMISASLWSQGVDAGSALLIDPERNVPGFEGTLTIPFFDLEGLGKVVGHVGSTETGFAVLRVATTGVENRILAAAEADGSYGAWDLALDKVYTLEGNFDGSVGGASVVQGQFDDEVIKGKVAIMSELVGLIPGAKLDGPAGALVGIADGQARSGLLGVFESSVVINEKLAINLLDSDALLGRSLLDNQVKLLARDESSSLGSVVVEGDQTPDEWRNGFGNDYDTKYLASVWNGTH